MNRRGSRWKTVLGRLDWGLIAIVALLAVIGIANLASASKAGVSGLAVAQTIWFVLGAVVIVGVCLVDYRFFARWAYPIFGGVVALLGGVLVVGTELNGARRWIDFGWFIMQPSELLKVAVVLVSARYFHDQSKRQTYTLRELAVPFALVGGAVLLVVQQPDLGTALVILVIFLSMVLFEGVRGSSLVVLAVGALIAIPVGWNFGMYDYQRERVLAFVGLEEERYGASWQVRQSVIAFGSGRVWGKGYGEGTQVDKGFVPEHENDFIAANWGEERGFVGMALLLVLYAALILRALRISRRARDTFGAQLSVGVAALIFWHVVLNLGMVTGLVPVVGLTLPLLSYGGSSLLTTLFAVGLLLNVSLRRKPLPAAG